MGNTPLVRLNKLTAGLHRNVYVKLEGLNPGGSTKTRAALCMIRDAERRGALKPGATIVEYTSGNQGIGLALVSAVLGYRCIIVMPACMSEERKRIVRAYGAQIITTEAEGDNIFAFFERARLKAEELVAENENYFLAGQFENKANWEAHYNGTAEEIIAQMGELPLHGFIAAVGTGGTITGCARRLRQAYPNAVMVAVEPTTAAILSGGVIGSHSQQGIGDGFVPAILDTDCYSRIVRVSDERAFDTAKRLATEEGIFCGISSGTNVWAAMEFAKTLPEGSNIVTVCVDLGDRYLSVESFIG
ncbi:MAG: cysteine synthase family protein [Clostridiales bacterium]|nr:cysteine synthase family protein [Clostridiales bacterium]